MTVSTTVRKQKFNGDGSDTEITVDAFTFVSTDDITVTSRVDATGVATVLVPGSHYTIEGGNFSTGTITIISPATNYPSGVTWTVERTTPRTQAVDYLENESFSAQSHESAIDKATFLVQEASDDADRALKIPSDDPVLSTILPDSVARASKSLGFDASGVPEAVAGTVSGDVVVSDFMVDVLDKTSAALTRTALGITASPINARGDLIRGDSSGNPEDLDHPGAADRYLTTDATDVIWSTKTMPTITGSGDAGKLVRVKADGTGYELVTPLFGEDTGWVTVASLNDGSFGAFNSTPHGLSAKPEMVVCALELAAPGDAPTGYAVGDRVLNYWVDAAFPNYICSFTFHWDETVFGFGMNNSHVNIARKSDGVHVEINRPNWRAVMRALI